MDDPVAMSRKVISRDAVMLGLSPTATTSDAAPCAMSWVCWPLSWPTSVVVPSA